MCIINVFPLSEGDRSSVQDGSALEQRSENRLSLLVYLHSFHVSGDLQVSETCVIRVAALAIMHAWSCPLRGPHH